MNTKISDAAVKAASSMYEAQVLSGANHELAWVAALDAALPHLAADAAPVQIPTGAIVNGAAFADRLERDYQFECQAGPLVNCSDYVEFRRCFDHLAQWASQLPTLYTHPQPAALNEVSGNSGELGGDERARCDACAGIGEVFSDELGHGADCPRCNGTGKQQAVEAVAARQPVSAEDWSHSMAEKEAGLYVGAGAHGIPDEPAARQPSAVVTTSERFTYGKLNRALPDGTQLYTTAATGVDLEQFRNAVSYYGEYSDSRNSQEEAERLLALIDSQRAAGPAA